MFFKEVNKIQRLSFDRLIYFKHLWQRHELKAEHFTVAEYSNCQKLTQELFFIVHINVVMMLCVGQAELEQIEHNILFMSPL